MESEKLNVIQLELKYCERCGGLWVRRMEGEEVYCPPCAIAMMDMACPSKRKSSPRLPVNHKVEEPGNHKLILVNKRGGNA